jgi:tyrosine-specific transport protein
VRLLGGILLIAGTAIGGGMLALPLATATYGFFPSILLLLAGWIITTCSAFLLLEVNLKLPPDSNLISIAKATLGKPGEIIAWLSYLLLLYCLLAAYISSGSDILQQWPLLARFISNSSLAAILFTLLMATIIYQGIGSVDYVNRLLMLGKFSVYALLVVCIMPYAVAAKLTHSNFNVIPASLNVIITSFGFAIIIPSLRSYYQDNLAQLKRIILIGTFIPLLCYLLWVAAILGSLSLQGDYGLIQIAKSAQPIAALSEALNQQLQNSRITYLMHIFTSICVATSFLGVGLSMLDFLIDGLQLKNSAAKRLIAILIAFLPPLGVVIYHPKLFIAGLSYAGTLCVILLILLPTLMAWRSRSWSTISNTYQAPGGNWLISLLLLAGTLLLAINFI